jgi:type IV pilus assembly protein PilY1
MRSSFIFLIVTLVTASAQAAPNAACWYRDLEQIDETMTPPEGGDNTFFSASAVSPNLIWVLDNSGSMQTIPCNGDCADYSTCGAGFSSNGSTYFADQGYITYSDPANVVPSIGVHAYPAFDPDFCSTAGNATAYSGNDGCYKPGLVYKHFDPSSYICTSWPSDNHVWVPDGSSDAATTINNWCANKFTAEPADPQSGGPSSCSSDIQCAVGYKCLTSSGGNSGSYRKCRLPTDWNNCASIAGYVCPVGYSCNPALGDCEQVTPAQSACVSNLERYGYAPGADSQHPVFTGDVLNFYPPKFVTARAVLKNTVRNTRQTRQALFTFNNPGVGGNGHGGKLLSPLGPSCNQFLNGNGQPILPGDPVFAAAGANIVTALGPNGSPYVEFLSGTPLAETLTNVCQYVSGSKSDFESRVKVHGSGGVGSYPFDGNVSDVKGNSAAESMCFTCEKTFVAYVTDGSPSNDDTVPCKLRNYDDDCREGLHNSPSCGTNSSCPPSQIVTYAQQGGVDYLDDVADFCYSEDLRPDMPGVQNAVTDTVGFLIKGNTVPILQRAAAESGGLSLSASTASELENALASIVSDVNTRGTSFSAASVTTVQTQGTTYAFIPRFQPSRKNLWAGHLFRFNLFNEFASGCQPADTVPPMTADKLSRNPNGNGTCSDVYLEDSTGKFVQEDPTGNYVLVDTSATWDSLKGWPLLNPPVPATPFWDASAQLQTRKTATDPRTIYTVVDSNGNGVLEPSEQIAFTAANVAAIEPYLALEGATGKFCSALATAQNKTYATEQSCAVDLINFVRGQDLLDENGNGNRTETRGTVLGDIFHSAPALITPPVPPNLCDLGVSTQCAFSLYGSQLTPNGAVAYSAWVTAQALRPQFVVVGANDGMFHAFNAGNWVPGDDPTTPVIETVHLDNGTGREMWAFIPPDILPKLKRMVLNTNRHEFYVDGSAMVRDVWVDSSTNAGQKDVSEFHTLAVVGERQGGRSYFALDVTNPLLPAFRWMYPPAGDVHSLADGQSWADFAPGAPPIGPVAVADSTGPITVNGTKADEVWSVFLNGGYDANLVRGRSISALNVWTGAEMWRFAAADTSVSSDLRSSLFPVAAPISMLDIGNNVNLLSTQDGLFDTAVVGDVMGQVWTLRFWNPGRDTNGDGLFDNWYAARSFVEFKGAPLAQRNPFFQMAEAAADPTSGEVRVYLGSGDRANIRDLDGGECSDINLMACVRKGCDVQLNPDQNQNGSVFFNGNIHHAPNDVALTTNTVTASSITLGGACSDATTQNLKPTVNCNTGASASVWQSQLGCDWNAADNYCATEAERPEPLFSTLYYAHATQNARFYAYQLFSATRPPFNTATDAAAYDQASLTDANLVNADTTSGGDLGWYIDYAGQNERTSNAAVVLGGCVQWNSLTPDPTPAACGGQVADTGSQYHAQFATGSTACGLLPATTPRLVASTAIVPPPTATPVVSVNQSTQQVQYSTVNVQAGNPPGQVVVGASDIAGPVFWLDLPREVHQCRHGTSPCN